MRFTYYPSREEVEQYYGTDETMMMLVSFDGESAVIAPAIETVEHHTLLAQAGHPGDGDRPLFPDRL